MTGRGAIRAPRPATSAELNKPTGVAIDAAGNLVAADDSDNGAVWVVPATSGTKYYQMGGPASLKCRDVARGASVNSNAGTLSVDRITRIEVM